MGDSSIASGFRTGFGSAFLQPIFERFASLGSVAGREIGLIWGADDVFRKLQRTFLKTQDLVDHMEGNIPLRFSGGGAHGGSKAWQIWFEDMRKLAYDADALLDHVSLRLSQHCAENNVHKLKQVFSMVVSSPSDWNVPHEIDSMQNKLEELTKELESLIMIEKVKRDSCKLAPTRLTQFMNFCSTTTFVDDANVVGREDDKQNITKLLTGEVYGRGNFSVIPIVGMGGIGKTTLAHLVYDDENVCNSFEMRMWVSVSMDFNVARITRSIIESATLSACNLSDLYSLQVILRKMLNGKRFLLVLDDYWSHLDDEWDVLSSPFRFCSPGSKIIVTTRSTKTSSIVGSSEAYKLRILLDDDCWNIIKQRVVANVEPNQTLESIGKQIASKCKGLPLVAVTLGSLLRCKNSEDEWHSIVESELWDMPQDTNVFPALMLSYLNLPVHLQKCFAYCSIFPQNHEFEVEELVLLWMAEGFIHPMGGRRLEDLGRDYFDDLHSRCFFQLFENNKERYKMHDVIHDMARLVSRDICSHVKYSMLTFYPLFGNVCHLSLLHDNTEPMELKASLENVRLRTFLAMGGRNAPPTGKVDPHLFLKLQSLRVLGLSNIGLTDVPDSISHLTYLRYLNLSSNPFLMLPKSMCDLVALQTLKLKGCVKLLQLPEEMWKLSNLRHLYLDVDCDLQWMPPQFGRLTNLQTLSLYVLGKKGKIDELKNMDSLRRSLCIKNVDYVSSESEAAEARLDKKKCLDKLMLQWRQLPDTLNTQALHQERDKQAEVLVNLKPYQNLKELVIHNYCGIRYPRWLSEESRKFTSIHLYGLKYCQSLPALGQLPWLKSFSISDMSCLETIGHTFYGTGNSEKFPLLESFELRRMPQLTDWEDVMNGDMRSLTGFTLDDCPNLRSLPQRLQDLTNKNISRCPNLPAGVIGQP